jgi:hypothetical protein
LKSTEKWNAKCHFETRRPKREARAEHAQEQELRHVKGAQEERTGTRVNDGDPTEVSLLGLAVGG